MSQKAAAASTSNTDATMTGLILPTTFNTTLADTGSAVAMGRADPPASSRRRVPQHAEGYA
jgi:hypothetical protein